MELTTIRFMRRRNLGNYEHSELEITDAVSKSDLMKATKELMAFVEDMLFDKVKEDKQLNLPLEEKKEEKVVVAKEKKTPAKEVEVKKEETKAEAKVEVAKEEVKVEVEKEVKAEKAAKKTPQKETKIVTKASKNTSYDRTLDAHKNNMGAYLDKAFPNWRVAANLKKAKKASEDLQGSDFLDADGNILDSFKEAFSKYMVDLV